MSYLLDTNICIRFINGRSVKIRDRFLDVDDIDIAFPALLASALNHTDADE